MLGFIGDYASWCYTRDDIGWFSEIHDNLLFRFVFAPIGATVMFIGPALIALLVLGLVLPEQKRAG